MTFLAETLGVVGAVTVAVAVASDSELSTQVSSLVPVDLAANLVQLLEATIAGAQLPERIVLAHPDVMVAEALLAAGHDVVVVVGPSSNGGPDISDVRTAHPAEVFVADLAHGFGDLTVFNSGLLLVGVSTPMGFAVQRLAALALERLTGRFPRRYALPFARMGRAPAGWTVVSRARITRHLDVSWLPQEAK